MSNVVITGEGTLDGCATFDDWWGGRQGQNHSIPAPYGILNHCDHVVLHGVTIQNSPSWNLHPYFSDDLRFLDLTILNPWDSPEYGWNGSRIGERSEIAGIYFSLGDDCIALKSGKYYMGHKYKVPSQNIEVRQCCMNNGHGAVTIGSEMAAGGETRSRKRLFIPAHRPRTADQDEARTRKRRRCGRYLF